ncbi:hypothetical protein ACET3Z_005878 [Daucus carota]
MDNQGGEGNIYLNGLNSRNNLPFHQLPLSTKHQTTPTFPNIERILEIDPNSNLDLSQELNEPIQGELDEVSTRRKGKWSTQEDRKFLSLVNKHGVGKWAEISKEMDSRNARQCSARWNDDLCPDIKPGKGVQLKEHYTIPSPSLVSRLVEPSLLE